MHPLVFDLRNGWQHLLKVLFCLGLSQPVWAAPEQLSLTYQLVQAGHVIATTQETLAVTGNQYRLFSRTQGVGVYQLMGERSLESIGQVVNNALQPSQFISLQSKQAKKNRVSRFDWQALTLTIEAKGTQTTLPLLAGAQDLLSVMYCWMWQPPKGNTVSMPVTNGKSLTLRQFRIEEEATALVTEAGRFEVVKLMDAAGDKVVYLAKDHQYLPVKLILNEDGKQLEQVLVKMETPLPTP